MSLKCARQVAFYIIGKMNLVAISCLICKYSQKSENSNCLKKNIEKFDEDFRFQLTKAEYDEVLRSKILTSKQIVIDSLSIDNKTNLGLW